MIVSLRELFASYSDNALFVLRSSNKSGVRNINPKFNSGKISKLTLNHRTLRYVLGQFLSLSYCLSLFVLKFCGDLWSFPTYLCIVFWSKPCVWIGARLLLTRYHIDDLIIIFVCRKFWRYYSTFANYNLKFSSMLTSQMARWILKSCTFGLNE